MLTLFLGYVKNLQQGVQGCATAGHVTEYFFVIVPIENSKISFTAQHSIWPEHVCTNGEAHQTSTKGVSFTGHIALSASLNHILIFFHSGQDKSL